ncbi:MAG: hypothetical protein PWQ18_282 [Clostridia bacterium]|nr:hypothetical protein [Clostridia bacterium]
MALRTGTGRAGRKNGISRQVLLLVNGLMCWLYFICTGAAAAAPAGQQQVDIQAAVGWEGRGVPGRTVPAVVDLHNPGNTDLEGVVEVVTYHKQTFPPPPGAPPGTPSVRPPLYSPAAAYGEALVLPAGGSKQVILWFPLISPDKLTFRFRAGEEILGSMETQLTTPPLSGPVMQAIGVLGQVPPALEKVRVMGRDGVPRVPAIFPLTARLLPEAPEHLEALQAVVVAGFDGGNLTAAQREALAAWVRQGGQLILAGGVDAPRFLAVLPEKDRPLTVGGTATRSNWQAAAAWLGLSGLPDQAATIARWQGRSGLPLGNDPDLGLEVKSGTGSLVALAFDPLLEPWRAGDGGQTLWQKLLDSNANDEMQMKYGGLPPANLLARLDSLMGTTRALPDRAFPPARAVALYLLLFIVLAGPVTFIWLRRRQQPEYAWLAVPLLGLTFAGAVYGYMLLSGGNVIINAVRVVNQDGGAGDQALTAVGFFAPTAARFEARLADPGVPVRVALTGRSSDEGKEDGQPEYTVTYGSDLAVAFSPATQWGMRTLAFQREDQQDLAGFRAELQVQGQALVGTIYNDTNLHLENVGLIAGPVYQAVPSLAPGAKFPVHLEIPPPPTTFDPRGNYGSRFQSWQLFVSPAGAAVTTTMSTGPAVTKAALPPPLPGPSYLDPLRPARPLTAEEQRRADLLNNFLYDNRWGGGRMGNSAIPLTLVAFCTEPMADLNLASPRGRTHYLTMVIRRPFLQLATGPFTLPAGLVQPVVDGEAMRGSSGHGNAMAIIDGHMVYAFRPGLPPEAKFEEITITFPFFLSMTPPGNPKGATGPPAPQMTAVVAGALEIYNPARQAWEKLAGANEFRLPSSYATPDGEVRLRVNDRQATGGQEFYFLPPSISYQGVKE